MKGGVLLRRIEGKEEWGERGEGRQRQGYAYVKLFPLSLTPLRKLPLTSCDRGKNQ